ncbi:7425_t:CDS:1, partial [Dentiscutata heterogama]
KRSRTDANSDINSTSISRIHEEVSDVSGLCLLVEFDESKIKGQENSEDLIYFINTITELLLQLENQKEEILELRKKTNNYCEEIIHLRESY